MLSHCISHLQLLITEIASGREWRPLESPEGGGFDSVLSESMSRGISAADSPSVVMDEPGS